MLSRFQIMPAIRQGSIILLDQGALSVANFITGILVARSTTKEEYGIYVLIWSVLMIVQGVHKGIASVPYTIYSPRLNARERTSYLGSILIHTFLMCVLATTAMLVVFYSNKLPHQSESVTIYSALPALALLLTPFLLRDFIRSVLLAKLNFAGSLKPNLIATVMQVGVVCLLFAKDWVTIDSVLIVLAATNGFAAAVMLYGQHEAWVVEKGKLWSDFIKNSNIGKWELANGLTYMAGYQIYPWLILAMLGPNDVAAFGACLAIANLPAPFLRSACAYMLPRMSHGFKDGDLETVMRLLRKSMLVILIPYGLWMLIGAVFGEYITVFTYSDKYSGYSVLLFWLLLRTTIESVAAPLTTALQTIEKIHVTTLSGVVGAVVTLIIGPLSIAWLGVIGAGVTSALAAFVMTGYRWYAIKKYYRDYNSANQHLI